MQMEAFCKKHAIQFQGYNDLTWFEIFFVHLNWMNFVIFIFSIWVAVKNNHVVIIMEQRVQLDHPLYVTFIDQRQAWHQWRLGKLKHPEIYVDFSLVEYYWSRIGPGCS